VYEQTAVLGVALPERSLEEIARVDEVWHHVGCRKNLDRQRQLVGLTEALSMEGGRIERHLKLLMVDVRQYL
jgi:hypothetical protein